MNSPIDDSSSTSGKLSLYYYDGCFFCDTVRRAISKLSMKVELRNIHREPKHMQDLLEARGRQTVPVLRIDNGADSQWLPESDDIVRFLHERGGQPLARGAGMASRFLPWVLLLAGALTDGVVGRGLLGLGVSWLVVRTMT